MQKEKDKDDRHKKGFQCKKRAGRESPCMLWNKNGLVSEKGAGRSDQHTHRAQRVRVVQQTMNFVRCCSLCLGHHLAAVVAEGVSCATTARANSVVPTPNSDASSRRFNASTCECLQGGATTDNMKHSKRSLHHHQHANPSTRTPSYPMPCATRLVSLSNSSCRSVASAGCSAWGDDNGWGMSFQLPAMYRWMPP